MNLIETYNKRHIESITQGKVIPSFNAGDTLKVYVKITEGNTERVQLFEGVCIARKNNSVGSTFTVRKISHGEGIEKIFRLYSPKIEKIEVTRKGKVRRAKLYYLRNLQGKAARIKERIDLNRSKQKNKT